MKISKGKIPGAKKVIVYGPEGIGKSTMAAQFPQPVFLDTEGSTKEMDVARVDGISNWGAVIDAATYVIEHPDVCKTLIIDTMDWAELFAINRICEVNHKASLEDFGYGKGYVYLQEEVKKLLDLLDKVVAKGVNVVLTAHAKMRKFEQPDEAGAYDRWEMKLSKQVGPMIKEWADMVLFANYKTRVVDVDGTKKAQGGKRVMYTTHHSCWDAKNRYGLPDEVPFSYDSIRAVIEPVAVSEAPQEKVAEKPAEQPKKTSEAKSKPVVTGGDINGDVAPEKEPVPVSPKEEAPERRPKAWELELRALMKKSDVSEEQVQRAIASKGVYWDSTPIHEYDEDFVRSNIIAKWEGFARYAKKIPPGDEIPFNP